jgi:predicted NAD-dependent protein-ADP-ribosyltransferase YbiA (DUF1768 family)
MTVDWRAVRRVPTAEIVRERLIPNDAANGVLWTAEAGVHLLSAMGALAWDGRSDKPNGPDYEWAGANLLCNGAPTSFEIDGHRVASVESFQKSLKFPEGCERAACRVASAADARDLTRHRRSTTFEYRGRIIAVDSAEHEGIIAEAIAAKVSQRPEVLNALLATGDARLAFPLTYAGEPGVLARVTPLALMIERWKTKAGGR